MSGHGLGVASATDDSSWAARDVCLFYKLIFRIVCNWASCLPPTFFLGNSALASVLQWINSRIGAAPVLGTTFAEISPKASSWIGRFSDETA
jgi:hypothetical protein